MTLVRFPSSDRRARRAVLPWRHRFRRLAAAALLLLLPLPAQALDPVAEEANCRAVEAVTYGNSAGILGQMEAAAQRLYRLPVSELSPDQMLRLTQEIARSNPGGMVDPYTPEDERRRLRCDSYQAWRSGHLKMFDATDSVRLAAGTYLRIWGNEAIRGIGCFCPGYQLGSESSSNGCDQPVRCHGRGEGLPALPDGLRGCRTRVAGRWLVAQLPALLRSLAVPADLQRPGPSADMPGMTVDDPLPAACQAVTPPAADLEFPPIAAASMPGSGAALAAADGPASRCYQSPEAQVCRQAAELSGALGVAAARAGNRICLVYSQIGRMLWTVAGNPDYTYLLTTFPEASRLRNEASIALRYSRANCKAV